MSKEQLSRTPPSMTWTLVDEMLDSGPSLRLYAGVNQVAEIALTDDVFDEIATSLFATLEGVAG